MNYKELIEQLRYESGQVARDEAADAIESLLAENEQFKEIEKTNDAMLIQLGDKNAVLLDQVASLKHCYAQLTEHAEKQSAELAKYRDVPVVGYATTNEYGDLSMLFFDAVEARKYSGDDEPIKLIVKPGE